MPSKLLVIAGGSGSGKSTLAIGLHNRYPAVFSLVQMDDYYHTAEDAPKLPDGKPDWDTPEALRFDDLVRDIRLLLNGSPITIRTKSELHNLGYRAALRNKIECTIPPRKIILVEGYLCLYDPHIRNLADLSIFLDMPIEESVRRRSSNKFDATEEYFQSVLIPAHYRFVAPTKRYANEIVKVALCSKDKVLHAVEGILKAQGFQAEMH
ncbi:MAG TPA: hypothetical protein VMU13_03370 [Candidatus Paceibacterota bacterium]|nr:hypothetical protein [Candidatus Paceibacterota bacterium]